MNTAPFRRLRSAAVALTLTAAAAGTAIAMAGPAHAISNICETTTALTINGSADNSLVHLFKYGTGVTLSSTVAVGTCQFTDGVPTSVESGTLAIQRSIDGGVNWSNVSTVDVSSGVNTTSKAGISGVGFLAQRTEFRAHYTGSSDVVTGDTFHDSYGFVTFAPYRVAKETGHSCTTKACSETWQIKPFASISGLRVKLQRKVGGVWTTKASRQVSTKGTFTYTYLRGTTRIVMPTARGYATSVQLVPVGR